MIQWTSHPFATSVEDVRIDHRCLPREIVRMRLLMYLALDAVPAGIDMNDVKEYLSGLPTCVDVHDLHVLGHEHY